MRMNRLFFRPQENPSPRQAKTLLLLAGVTTLVVGLFNALLHAQSANAGVIHACVQDASGIMRIVAANVSCRENE